MEQHKHHAEQLAGERGQLAGEVQRLKQFISESDNFKLHHDQDKQRLERELVTIKGRLTASENDNRTLMNKVQQKNLDIARSNSKASETQRSRITQLQADKSKADEEARKLQRQLNDAQIMKDILNDIWYPAVQPLMRLDGFLGTLVFQVITEPIIGNGKGLAEVKLILDETEGAPRPGKRSAIDIAHFCNRVANVHAREGNKTLAAGWNDLAHRAHAKATFAWRLKVNNEFGGYVNFGPDIYTMWRRKRGTADYPYATGSRSLDIDQGFCVPIQAPDNAALDVWLARHRSLILDSAAQELAS